MDKGITALFSRFCFCVWVHGGRWMEDGQVESCRTEEEYFDLYCNLCLLTCRTDKHDRYHNINFVIVWCDLTGNMANPHQTCDSEGKTGVCSECGGISGNLVFISELVEPRTGCSQDYVWARAVSPPVPFLTLSHQRQRTETWLQRCLLAWGGLQFPSLQHNAQFKKN